MAEPRGERPQMPDYGVDTENWEALPWSWAAERLERGRNFWIVTVSGAGRLHALPVWGVWDDGEHRFAFSCGTRARKARNLAANDRIVIGSEDTVECISIEGRAELLTDEARRDVWVERYVEKYRPISPDLTPEFVRGGNIYEVTPEVAFGIIEHEHAFSERATRWRFAT
jgi:general stress protein 26